MTQNAIDRLSDPGEHYPYRLTHAQAILQANPPAGPQGVDDDAARVSDFISAAIITASDEMIAAQIHAVSHPDSPGAAEAYKLAKDALVQARVRHRANRGERPNVVAIRGAE